jgi:hypothetical protein
MMNLLAILDKADSPQWRREHGEVINAIEQVGYRGSRGKAIDYSE